MCEWSELTGAQTHNQPPRRLKWNFNKAGSQPFNFIPLHSIKQKKLIFLFFDFVSFHLLNEAELKEKIL